MCMNVLSAYVYSQKAEESVGIQEIGKLEEIVGFPGTGKLQVVMSHYMSARNQTQVLCKKECF